MNPNPINNSDKEKEAEIAANRLVEMLEQQALYARIAKINEETKGNTGEEEEADIYSPALVERPSKIVYLKWAIAASFIIGSLLVYLTKESSTQAQIALENTEFRGTEYTQSRSVINGEFIRRAYADIDDLIDADEFDKAKELLDTEEEAVGKTHRKGIVAYLTNDFSEAAKAFQEVVESENIEYIENAYWNLLLAHKNAGVLTKAKEVAQEMQSNKYITKKQKKAALQLIE